MGSGTVPRKGRRLERAAGFADGTPSGEAPGRQLGFTLIELVVVVLILVVLTAAAVPSATSYLHERRLKGAALHVRSLMRQARARAASENRYVGIVFDEVDGDPVFTLYGDGNGNGIRRADIRAGVEEKLREPYRLSGVFPGVHYGHEPEGTDATSFPGLRIGRSKIVSFSPIGSCTPGTLFLSNDYDLVYAVVLFGTTGRVRIARHLGGQWQSI